MGVSFLPLWLDLVGVLAIGIAVWWLIVALIFWFRNKDFVYARGANGNSGDQVTLACPVGKVIKAGQIHLQCGDLDASGKQPMCEPFLNNGKLNPSNTSSIKSFVEGVCNGQNGCTFTIPPASGICNGCQQFQMVGTYSCQ